MWYKFLLKKASEDPYDLSDLSESVDADDKSKEILDSLKNGTPYTSEGGTIKVVHDTTEELPADQNSKYQPDNYIDLWHGCQVTGFYIDRILETIVNGLSPQGIDVKSIYNNMYRYKQDLKTLENDIELPLMHQEDIYHDGLEKSRANGMNDWSQFCDNILDPMNKEERQRISEEFLPRYTRICKNISDLMRDFKSALPYGPYMRLWNEYIRDFSK